MLKHGFVPADFNHAPCLQCGLPWTSTQGTRTSRLAQDPRPATTASEFKWFNSEVLSGFTISLHEQASLKEAFIEATWVFLHCSEWIETTLFICTSLPYLALPNRALHLFSALVASTVSTGILLLGLEGFDYRLPVTQSSWNQWNHMKSIWIQTSPWQISAMHSHQLPQEINSSYTSNSGMCLKDNEGIHLLSNFTLTIETKDSSECWDSLSNA